jgi:hypothetical protein
VRHRALFGGKRREFLLSLSSAKEPCTSYKRARYLNAGLICRRERKKKFASVSAKRALYRTQKSPIPHAKEAYFDRGMQGESDGFFLPPTATPSNIKQHTLQHTLQHTTTHSNTLQHTHTASAPSLRCHPLQHKATHCNAHCNTQGNTLQHAATHLHSVMLGSSASGPRYSPFHTHDSHSS